MQCFLQQGYGRTSMDTIRDAAGVSKQTIYSHFCSKEDLFQAVVSQKCPGADLPDDLVDPARPCREALIGLGKHAISILLDKESIQVYRLCVDAAEQNAELSQLFFTTGPERFITHLAEYLADMTRSGRLAVDHPRLAASQLMMVFRGEAGLRMELNVPLAPIKKERAIHIERCVDVFLAYYGVN